MQLGAFSISLAVKNLAASRAFYEALGFSAFGGDPAQNWLILKQGSTVIGLFQGMFDQNMLTFNPGWDSDAQPLQDFSDVREIQKHLQVLGIVPTQAVDEAGQGPGYLMLLDPDGNPVLIDQHV
ncbi:MAG: VOC family protein [Candidatus Delongbacteria bacterium]